MQRIIEIQAELENLKQFVYISINNAPISRDDKTVLRIGIEDFIGMYESALYDDADGVRIMY